MLNNAKPTLGFDTKREAILYLHARGYPRAVIARDVGSSPVCVSVVLNKLGLKPHPAATGARGVPYAFLDIPPDVLKALRPHAARRGLTCAALAARLLDTIATDDLVDATLDDREGGHA